MSCSAGELPILNVPVVEVASEDTVRVQWAEVSPENCIVTSYVIKYKSEKVSVWSEVSILVKLLDRANIFFKDEKVSSF